MWRNKEYLASVKSGALEVKSEEVLFVKISRAECPLMADSGLSGL
jgi:hypothetical protein